jgi:hypothetical protein
MSGRPEASAAPEKKGAPHSPKAQPAAHAAGAQAIAPSYAAAGNQAMQVLLRTGVIQASLQIGSPDDPLEREAEGAAERIDHSERCSRGIPCSHSTTSCGGCKHQLVQRKIISPSNTAIHPTPSMPLILQPKLAVSQPGDPLEQEADHLAETAASSHDPGRCEGVTCPSGGCSACHHSMAIQRKAANGAPAPRAIAGLDHTLGSGGRPLDPPVRSAMEDALGADFSAVLVHTNDSAAKSAESIQALAYTAGSDVVFGAGRYAPETAEGRKLLAHELAHVTQQRPGVLSRAVTPYYSTIRGNLSYGIIDWAITEAECDQVLYILSTLTPGDFDDTVRRMQRDGLVDHLIENTSPSSRIAHATMIRRLNSMASLGPAIGYALEQAIRSHMPSAAEPSVTEPVPEAASRAPESFDPCQVDAYALTNAGLLSYYRGVYAVVSRGRDARGYFNNRNLQRRLITERDRRYHMGHRWLETMPDSIPQTLYRITRGPARSLQAIRVPGSTVAGRPADISDSPLGTRTQMEQFLAENSIERVSASEYIMRREQAQLVYPEMAATMVAGGRLYTNPLDYFLMDPFARPALNVGGNVQARWWGRLGEAGVRNRLGSGFGRWLEDLNARNWVDRLGRPHYPTQESYPVFDFERRTLSFRGIEISGIARISVKTSLQAVQADRFAYYRQGMAEMLQAPGARSALPTYIANDPQLSASLTGANYPEVRAQTLSRAYMAINADDIADFRRLLSDPSRPASPGGASTVWQDPDVQLPNGRPITGWRTVLTGVMRDNPVRIQTTEGSRLFSTPQDLDNAYHRSNPIISEEQYLGVQRQIGRRAAEMVISHTLRTAGGIHLRTARAAIPLTEQQLRGVLTEERVRAIRQGEIIASTRAGLRGGGYGGVIALITNLGVILLDTHEHPDWERELLTSGGLGSLGSGLGSGFEQATTSGLTRLGIRGAASPGGTRFTRGVSTTAGRLGGGAIGAMFVEGISMGVLEEREHFAPEIATRTVRSGLLGAGSVWAGGAAGAAVGSVVPVAGTAVGFVVGLIVGGVIYAIGDLLVPGGRADWEAREAGCRPIPSLSRWGGTFPARFCFKDDTPVTMADGTQKRIDRLREGDAVLSYDERNASLHSETVLKVERLVAPAHLKLRLSNAAAEIELTGEHPLHTKGLWTPANTLRAGSTVTWLDPKTNEVGEADVAEVTDIAQPASVYDISVSNCHTFFAGGLLAHNKM